MSRRIVEHLRHIHTHNRGFWLSAKIYNDQRGACACGGEFSAREVFKKLIEYPVCDKCGEEPRLFRIRAKVVDANMEEKYIDLRHFNGERLKDIVDVFSALKQVKAELDGGTFDIKKYDSKESREAYLFENFSESYLAFHENRLKRNELSPSGFLGKQTSVRNLLPYFRGRDISGIRVGDIDTFKNSFTDRFRARDLALGELKAILNHAHRMEYITKVPKFELVPSSKKRKEIISLETARSIVDAVEDPQYQFMLRLLLVYPVRPGELRALKWLDVDYFSGKVVFQRHFSLDKLIEGRKSVSSGDKSEIEFPLTEEFKQYLLSIPRPLKRDAFIFHGRGHDFVSGKCLSRAWNKANKKLNLPPSQLYEMRHARLSQIAEQSNGDMVKLLRVSGHTNPKTLMERYVRDTSDLKEYFQ